MSDPHHETSLGEDAAALAGAVVIDLVMWLVPVGVLGAIGAALISIGEEEVATDSGPFASTTTHVNSVGWVGFAFVCLAVAVFFGRGTIGRLYDVVKGRGSLGDIFLMRSRLASLGIAVLAIAVGLLSLAFASGVVDPPDDHTTYVVDDGLGG